MGAHDGLEGSPLIPAHVQFVVGHVLDGVAVAAGEEPAEVSSPVGYAAEAVVQPGGELAAHIVPGGSHVAAPRVGGVVLLTEERRAGEQEHALLVGSLALVLIHALVRDEREGVVNAAEAAQVGLGVEVGVLYVEVVRLGGVEPPGVHAEVEDVALHLGPVEVARCGVERVVGLHAGLARPRLEVVECAYAVHLVVHIRPRAERGPHRNHYVCVLLVYVVNHLLGAFNARFGLQGLRVFALWQEAHVLRVANLVDIARVLELHRVPVRVASPVLPVLYDAVERHLQLAVLVNHAAKLVGAFVAFAALPEAERPERVHGCLARELPHARNHAVGRAAVDEVVVGAVAHLGVERHLLRVVRKRGGRIVVPVESVALGRMHEGYADFHVLVAQQQLLVALRHEARLLLAKAVDYLVGVEQECLAHGERGRAGIVERRELRAVVLVTEHLVALCVGEGYAACLGVDAHHDRAAGHGGRRAAAAVGQAHGLRLHYDGYAHLIIRLARWLFIHSDNAVGEELNPHLQPLRLEIESALGTPGGSGSGRHGHKCGKRCREETDFCFHLLSLFVITKWLLRLQR